MIKVVNLKNAKIRYSDRGRGIPLVFLHGYLEALEIWDEFTSVLENHFRIISLDIPGHGKSEIVSGIHTMDLMAEIVKELLDRLDIEECVLVGHSMGGYVTMAFLENYPDRLLAFSLFHSTPFSDNEEKKKNRDREIELVRAGKKDVLFNTNVPRAFANENLSRMANKVDFAVSIAEETPEEGIIALLEGMKRRPNRSGLLKDTTIPFLLILGKKDNYIHYEKVGKKIELPTLGQRMVLDNAGHMGFIEEKEKSAGMVLNFVHNLQ